MKKLLQGNIRRQHQCDAHCGGNELEEDYEHLARRPDSTLDNGTIVRILSL